MEVPTHPIRPGPSIGSEPGRPSLLALLPAAALAYALLGQTAGALAAAASWALAAAVNRSTGGGAESESPRQAPVRPGSGRPGRPPRGPAGQILRLPAALTTAVFFPFLAVLLAAELLRAGSLGHGALLDSLRTALTCTALLVPLGLPAAESLLPGGARNPDAREIRAFQLSSCAGMSLAVFGAVLAGWIPPLAPNQALWANLAGSVFPALALGLSPGTAGPPPADPASKPRPAGDFREILARGVLLAVLLLAAYRLGLASAGEVPRAAARARSLAFLVLCLIQSGEPLAGMRKSCRAGRLQSRIPGWGIRLAACLAALSLTAAAFSMPAARSLLGLLVPEPVSTAAALAAAGGFAALRAALAAAFRRGRRA